MNIFILCSWFLQVLTTSCAMFYWHSTLSHQISRQAFMKTVATRKWEQEIRSISISIVEFIFSLCFLFSSFWPFASCATKYILYSTSCNITSSLLHLYSTSLFLFLHYRGGSGIWHIECLSLLHYHSSLNALLYEWFCCEFCSWIWDIGSAKLIEYKYNLCMKVYVDLKTFIRILHCRSLISPEE